MYSWKGNEEIKIRLLRSAKKYYFEGWNIFTPIKNDIFKEANWNQPNTYPKYQFWYDIVKDYIEIKSECSKIGMAVDYVRLTIDLYVNSLDNRIVTDVQVQKSLNLAKRLSKNKYEHPFYL